MAVGAYPGSFDPLTTAHVAIAEAALDQLALDRVDLVMSRVALAKEHPGHSSLEARSAAIAALGHPGIRARVSELRLVADLAEGYDACIVGADKWHQLHDLAFYDGSTGRRDAALARLPLLAVVPRAGIALPDPGEAGFVLLQVDPALAEVSSTAVRDGRHEWRA